MCTYVLSYVGYRDANPRPDRAAEPNDTEERELQAAIQRSLDDQETTPIRHTPLPSASYSENPTPPASTPPPYNPYYNASVERTENSEGVRRRPTASGAQGDDRDSLNTVRSARLKRFSTNT